MFTSYLSGPGVTNSNVMGLWATDPGGNLDLIVRDGDQYNLNGTLKTIASVGLLNDRNQWGTNTDGINDRGQLSIEVGFTDNTEGLILVQLPVPEPSSVVLLIAGGWGLPWMIVKRRRLRRADQRSVDEITTQSPTITAQQLG